MTANSNSIYRWNLKQRRLTEREVEIVQLIAQGYSGGEVAERMGISKASVFSGLAKVRRKLEARNTLHAVVIALRTKVI